MNEYVFDIHACLNGMDYYCLFYTLITIYIAVITVITEFISINLYTEHCLKYKVYMHNITRDSRKKEDSFLGKKDKHSIIM